MAEKIPVKGNDGFFLQVDKIFLDLLHCTELNIYGILILAQVYEFKRNKKPCIMSTQSLCDLFKTSHYTIENQLKLLCELKLINKVVKTNRKNTISRVRELTIPSNFAKTMEKLLKEKDKKQPQNFEVPSTQKASSKFEDKQAQNSHTSNPKNIHISNPQNLRNNNINDTPNYNDISFNDKLLEDNSMSSPTSSTDDYWNATDEENVSIPDVIDDANFDLYLKDNSNNDKNTENMNTENVDMKDPNNPNGRYANQKYDEMSAWYFTQLNPISRYNYEIKYNQAAMNFAWGERERKDNQKDYYTPQQIVEYFTQEKQLDYLKQIHWEHLWMLDI